MIRCSSFLFFLVFALHLNAQDVSAFLSNDQIRIGEQSTIEWELRCSAGSKAIKLPAIGDTISKQIDVIDLSEIDTTYDQENIEVKIFKQRITITSWDSGFHAIPPFVFIVDDKEYKTAPLLLTVNTVELSDEQDIKDIKTIIDEPFSLWEWIKANLWTIVLISAGLIAFSIGVYFYLKYLKRPKTELISFIPKESADQLAIKQLELLKSKKLWQSGNVKGFHVELSHILREYIEHRYQFRALELTRDEILALMARTSQLSKELTLLLDHNLSLSDMAKFAKVQPLADENEKALKFAFQFVEETKFKEKSAEDSPVKEPSIQKGKEDQNA